MPFSKIKFKENLKYVLITCLPVFRKKAGMLSCSTALLLLSDIIRFKISLWVGELFK